MVGEGTGRGGAPSASWWLFLVGDEGGGECVDEVGGDVVSDGDFVVGVVGALA